MMVVRLFLLELVADFLSGDERDLLRLQERLRSKVYLLCVWIFLWDVMRDWSFLSRAGSDR